MPQRISEPFSQRRRSCEITTRIAIRGSPLRKSLGSTCSRARRCKRRPRWPTRRISRRFKQRCTARERAGNRCLPRSRGFLAVAEAAAEPQMYRRTCRPCVRRLSRIEFKSSCRACSSRSRRGISRLRKRCRLSARALYLRGSNRFPAPEEAMSMQTLLRGTALTKMERGNAANGVRKNDAAVAVCG